MLQLRIGIILGLAAQKVHLGVFRRLQEDLGGGNALIPRLGLGGSDILAGLEVRLQV